jgi:hypothetical protein
MKQLLFFIAAVLIFPVTAVSADSPFFKVNGQIKNYTKTEYAIIQKFGDYFRTPDKKYTWNLDANGREMDMSEFNGSGTLINKITYAYDDKGNMTSQICTDSANTTAWKVTYTYDEKGNKMDESDYNKDGVLSGKSVFNYPDSKQNEETYYNGTGVLIWKNISKFDDNGRKTETCQYFADGTLDQRLTYVYNDTGKLVEIGSYDGSGNQTKLIQYIFNNDGIISETSIENIKDNLKTREFYKYDENKNLIKIFTYNIFHKFGTTVNELNSMSEYTYVK